MTTLIMGKSGSGKSTFYQSIKDTLGQHLYLNNDEIRNLFNNFDFSIEGRLRQATRMKALADKNIGLTIIDMICPLKEMREIIKPDTIIFINREGNGIYKHTDDMFVPPTEDEALWNFVSINF